MNDKPIIRPSRKPEPHQDQRIRCAIYEETGTASRKVIFAKKDVRCIIERDDNQTIVITQTLPKLLLQAHYDDVEKAIYDNNHTPIIDLTHITTTVKQKNERAVPPPAQPKFNAIANTAAPLSMHLYCRQHQQETYVAKTISDSEVEWSKTHTLDSKMVQGAHCTCLYLKAPAWGDGDHIINLDMPIGDFIQKYTKARMAGAPTLDLTKDTLPQKYRKKPLKNHPHEQPSRRFGLF
ncbi:MAG: hypothetical protein OXT65_06710 [Alphaproteobacteria bacterium]|nr:hypothetical protein [Alphaproteobacteria bacterium]